MTNFAECFHISEAQGTEIRGWVLLVCLPCKTPCFGGCSRVSEPWLLIIICLKCAGISLVSLNCLHVVALCVLVCS